MDVLLLRGYELQKVSNKKKDSLIKGSLFYGIILLLSACECVLNEHT